ncbi:uncharacterized protein LOC128861417 [Anastrepha ludens]|uniref:uncharacterized protein LOC128861417 n=1 Tax=Anastrepha ludens TaxID=28586 RepID=UPI0023B15D60|nr:uncharacterized protein LOC128861417 [Anastrepha ludens]
MLDTIVYIPTILAYVFISLLVIILCFIVVYISHRIYVCIYDNLPVAHAALASIMSMDYKESASSKSHSGITLLSASSLQERKTKTALRIIVSLSPTYLAYVTLEGNKCNKDNQQQNKFIKYYDRLSEIPMADRSPTCVSERQLYSSSRRGKEKQDAACTTASSNILGTSTNAVIESIGTSTTRLQLNEETAKNNQETAERRASTFGARPSVTFANAVEALANIKITAPEDS